MLNRLFQQARVAEVLRRRARKGGGQAKPRRGTQASSDGPEQRARARAQTAATRLVFNSCTNAAFLDCGSPVSAAPFGSFVAGAALGGDWLGGGSPNAGIAIGASATFNFTISGSAALLGALTAEDVFNDENDRSMVVRFRGGVGGWSDKVLGCAQPAPGAVALLGVAGMFGARRRR